MKKKSQYPSRCKKSYQSSMTLGWYRVTNISSWTISLLDENGFLEPYQLINSQYRVRRGATPLLCETKSWVTRSRSVNAVEPPAGPRPVLTPWLKLKCCDNRDYCNADNDDDDEDDDDGANASARKRTEQTERTRLAMDREMLDDGPANRDATPTMQPDRKYDDDSVESVDRLLRDRVRALHVAALVLAVAALISVLASYYVVTRSISFFTSTTLFTSVKFNRLLIRSFIFSPTLEYLFSKENIEKSSLRFLNYSKKLLNCGMKIYSSEKSIDVIELEN